MLRELCRLHKIKMPNEAVVLLSGESSSEATSEMAGGSVSGSDRGWASGSGVKTADDSIDQSIDDQYEAGYGSDDDTSISSIDSDNFESLTKVEEKSRSKDDTPPFKKAHMDVFKKIVGLTIPNRKMN